MNMWNLKSLKSLATIGLMAALSLAGCASNGGTTYEYDSKGSSYWSAGQKKAAAPAPAPATPTKAATPAPAPAPTGDGLNWVSAYFPTGDKASSGLWVQKGFPTEAAVGEEFCYFIKVTNLTSATLTDVVVNDTVPAGFTVSSTDPAPESNEGGKLRWRFPSMKGAEVKTIKVCGKASAVGDLGGCATATYNNELCHKVKIVQPSLVLVKTLTPAAIQCDPITMTLKVTNNGSGAAKNVKIADTLPDGLATVDGKPVAFDVGTLPAGASKDYTVALKATKKGTFDNTATATADGGLKAEAKASTKVTKPELAIAQDCPKVVFIGKEACNDITVTNKGDAEAKTASLAASIPAGATFVSATDGGVFANGQVTWNLGTLAPAASKKVTVCYRPGAQGSYKVDAAAKAYCADAVTSNCVTEVKGIPAILLEVVDVNDPVEVGKNEIYTITATNQGSQAGKNVKIVVTLEENAELVNTDGSATKGTAAGKVITFEALPTLAPAPGPNNKAVWKVVVKAVKEGDVRFKVTMTEDGLTRPVEETEATNFYK